MNWYFLLSQIFVCCISFEFWAPYFMPSIYHDMTSSPSWCSWTRYSDQLLDNAEKKILSTLKTPYKGFYVDIGGIGSKKEQSDRIWTISLNEDSNKTPLVMVHGMAAALALWCPNLDTLAAHRPVYAIDLLGFGRSSRPKFSPEALKAEAQWVESVEEWRRELALDQFILLGHSLGGYIATAYSIKYPERVRHLILADPWGFPEGPTKEHLQSRPLWVRTVAAAMKPFNPLAPLRAAGPAGQWLVSKARSDISRKYAKHLSDAETVIPEYIYQCNSQTPSGESAFHTLMHHVGWSKHPMVRRLHRLHPAVPITGVYGARSWVQASSAEAMRAQRPDSEIYIKIIEGAGHHIYLDFPDIFNKFVLEACARADEYDPLVEIHGTIKTNTNREVNTSRAENQSPLSNTAGCNQSPLSNVAGYNQSALTLSLNNQREVVSVRL